MISAGFTIISEMIKANPDGKFKVSASPSSLLFLILSPILIISFGGLLSLAIYHWLMVVLKNETTYEQIKKKYDKYYVKPN